MTRLLLADDHDLVRETIGEYLRLQGGHDVAQANSLDGALSQCGAGAGFDLVLLDYAMPGMDALAGLARMKARARCPVAILSGIAPPEVARRAIRAGAAGFLPKTMSPRALIGAVDMMLVGGTFVPPGMDGDMTAPGAEVALTGRERDVLRGISDGQSNKEIARVLGIQEVTVKLHLKTLSRKLGARNRTHAAMLARDLGLT